MTTAQRRMLIIGLVPLLVLVVTGAAVTVATIRGKLPYTYAASFEPGPQGVGITSDVQTVLRTSGDGRVHVTADGTYTVTQPSIQVTTTDGRLVIDASCPDGHCLVELTVELPPASATRVKVTRASINGYGVASPLSLDASDGSIELTGLESPRVSADTERGSIDLMFDQPPEQVTATASDGSLTVQVPRSAAYAIDAVAAQGSSELNLPSDPSATRRLYLRTSYGSITVQ
ncbi:DUF4097 family beta strand repeat-containing protein [Kribbella sp. NPDC055071]